MKKQPTQTRTITGHKAEQIIHWANKLVSLQLCSVEQRRAYFNAIRTLRELSDEYCKICGLELV